MANLPLLRGFGSDSDFAYGHGVRITPAEFLQHAAQLARQLPDRAHILNVCSDRYHFAVGLAAALMRGQLTLLPPNEAPHFWEQIARGYPDSYCLVDSAGPASSLPALAMPARAGGNNCEYAMPEIAESQLAVIVFTSGSTGEPVAQPKTWGTLVASGSAEWARLGLDRYPRMALLATVPPQHMYGLESTVLMPMQGGLALDRRRPFFAADICAALEELPRPRMLITTPVHLRALLADSETLPATDLVICATAPLSPQLAAQAEARFSAPVYEIYGCTEAGQIATRRTVQSPEWQTLPGMKLRQDDEGTWVRGGHVATDILLHDVIELRAADRFLLHGRTADLVNVAGKRTSLTSLNYHLNSIEGVRDGVFVVPPDSGEGVSRLAAFVVAPGVPPEVVMEALRQRIDPAFLPRPLTCVDQLPRNATGKIPRRALELMTTGLARRTA